MGKVLGVPVPVLQGLVWGSPGWVPAGAMLVGWLGVAEHVLGFFWMGTSQGHTGRLAMSERHSLGLPNRHQAMAVLAGQLGAEGCGSGDPGWSPSEPC